jgi:hypothetical protein
MTLRCRSQFMAHPSLIDPESFDPAAVARCERLLDLAPHVGVDPEALEHVRRRLVAHEREREGMLASLRRDELDVLIREGIETICQAIVKLQRAVDRMPSA